MTANIKFSIALNPNNMYSVNNYHVFLVQTSLVSSYQLLLFDSYYLYYLKICQNIFSFNELFNCMLFSNQDSNDKRFVWLANTIELHQPARPVHADYKQFLFIHHLQD